MKSKYIVALLLMLMLVTCQKSIAITLKSPGGKIEVKVNIFNKQLNLAVVQNGTKVLSDCSLGLVMDNVSIGRDVSITGKVIEKTIHEEYSQLGNHSTAVNHCQEMMLPLKSRNISYQLFVRAYNDGVAVKFVIPDAKNKVISSDGTTFPIQASAQCFWAPYADSNEEIHAVSSFSGIPENQAIVAPFTVKTGNSYMAFSEAGCVDFPDMSWIKQDGAIKANFTTNIQGWKNQQDSVVSPWRCVVLVDNLNDLVNSDLISNLCKAPESHADFSWVKPGRVLWQWWSVGAPKFEDQKLWFDAAARLTWEYYLIDDGWRDWRQPGKDQWQCLKEVIAYGDSVGVKSIVWVDSKEMRDKESLRAYLTKVKQVGAKGIKIDFIPPATPEIMQWYEMAREETYKLQLMCDFHGCIKPTGLHRTWPHEMTREGVRGNEYQMTRYNRLMPLDQDEIIPFTRFIAGPADFTPVIFDAKELRGYTWAHELAQAVIYNSPLTHFADNFRYYLDNQAEDVLRDIPVVWDETYVLPCSEIGKVVAFAKRKGNEWWIGVMNGKDATRLSFDLGFLTADAKATVLKDNQQKANSFVREEKHVRKGEPFIIDMQPGGGYVMRLRK
jgi:Glycoside hydrolase 97.